MDFNEQLSEASVLHTNGIKSDFVESTDLNNGSETESVSGRTKTLRENDLDKSVEGCSLPQIRIPRGELFGAGSINQGPPAHIFSKGYRTLKWCHPFKLTYNNAVLPEVDIAYETWGELNGGRNNAILIYPGISLNSHVRSTEANPDTGWWETFVGPGLFVDTNKFFVICTNHLGGCFGTSGPSTINHETKQPYATTFPIIDIEDIVRASFLVVDYFGIETLYASIGGSMGGMCVLMAAALYPDRIGRLISISACAYSHPSLIALWSFQRRCIMADPNWNQGRYYDNRWPTLGMRLAREAAWRLFRSGPEWDERFGRKRIEESRPVDLCHTFMVESYVEHHGEKFCNNFDPNALIYLSKALDLFDMTNKHGDQENRLALVKCPVLVIGVRTDILYPISQQRELVHLLHKAGNSDVILCETTSKNGHDSFLLDREGIGTAIQNFLDRETVT